MHWRQYKSSANTMLSASTFLEGTGHKFVFNTCNLIKWLNISLALSLVMPWPENPNTMPPTHYPHPHADYQWWIKMPLFFKRKDSPPMPSPCRKTVWMEIFFMCVYVSQNNCNWTYRDIAVSVPNGLILSRYFITYHLSTHNVPNRERSQLPFCELGSHLQT